LANLGERLPVQNLDSISKQGDDGKRGDVASSQAPPWPKNRLRIRPAGARLVWGAYQRGTRQRLSEAVWAHLISTCVNKPENDDPSIVEPIELAAATA
jgi:hypothetical protein